MYVLNHNPNKESRFLIRLNMNGKFYQLLDVMGGVVAEADSWRRLKKWGELQGLKVKMPI